MYEHGANAFQMLLIFVGPIVGVIAGGLSSTNGHLRGGGGVALAAAVLFGSVGLMQATEVIGADGVGEFGWWILALPASGFIAAALTATALYWGERGVWRRVMFVAAGLIFPVSTWPLLMSIGVFYVIAGWAGCFTLAWRNPPLRSNEAEPTA